MYTKSTPESDFIDTNSTALCIIIRVSGVQIPPPLPSFPTIDRLGKGIAADQGGKLALDLDLEPLSGAVRVDCHALDEGHGSSSQGTRGRPLPRRAQQGSRPRRRPFST